MALKINLIFSHPGGSGWSETYYMTSGAVFDTMASLQQGNALSPAPGNAFLMPAYRRQLLGYGCLLIAFRVTDMSGQRNGFYQRVDGAYQGSTLTTSIISPLLAGQPLPPDNALLVDFFTIGGNIYRKPVYLGGIPQGLISTSGDYSPPTNWTTALVGWINSQIGNVWGTNPRPTRTGAVQMVYFAPQGDAETALLQPVPGADPAGTTAFYVLRGIKYPRGWNGTHKGVVVHNPPGGPPAGDYVSIGPTHRPMVTNPTWSPLEKSTVQKVTTNVLSMQKYLIQGIVGRQRGRIFGVPPGRRPPAA